MKKVKLELTASEVKGALWALGNFALSGNYQDTYNNKRLYASICRAYDKLKAAQQ